MPESNVRSYIRNGRRVRGYRRRGRGVQRAQGGSPSTPVRSVGVSGFATTVVNISEGFVDRATAERAAEAYNAAVADLNKLERALDPPRSLTAQERNWAQMLYNTVVTMRQTAQQLRLKAKTENQTNAANRLLDHVEGVDDRMYALFDKVGFEAKEIREQSGIGKRASAVAAITGWTPDDGTIETVGAKAIVGGKRAIDRVGSAIKDVFS